jgi:serine/threonine-protein kinase
MSQADRSQPAEDTLAWGGGGSAPSNRDLTGLTLGDFQVQRMLGRGGMGEVYLARQISLNRQVALKVLRPDLLTKANYLRRFEAEATAVAKLNHPNIVHIYTLGNEDGYRFIAMEYVQGTNLRDYLTKKGALDYPLAFSIMKQAGIAVEAAGEIGLIHRDIKPENILLTRKGQVKIADFGLCRDLDAAQVHLTQPGVTMGTPLYMSPEQAQGHLSDHRSDLYSLGVTFYHMLAGQPPFRGDSPVAIALKHLKDTPVSLVIHRPDIRPELDQLVLKLMQKNPDDRYQSAAEMLRDLSKVKEAMNASTALVGPSDFSVATPTLDGSLKTQTGLTSPSRATSQGLATQFVVPRIRLSGPSKGILCAIVVVCLVAGAIFGWLSRPTDLLAAKAPEPELPGLWMGPEWTSIAQQPTAEAQYRYAQFQAPRDESGAAWLAVPGHFPRSHDWVSEAYVQVARDLFRKGDVERLKLLGGELTQWSDNSTDEDLAALISAAVAVLERDPAGASREIDAKVKPQKLGDPALAEFGVEITARALDVASHAAVPTTVGLVRNRNQLTNAMISLMNQAFNARIRVQGGQPSDAPSP